jgi:cytochrome P450
MDTSAGPPPATAPPLSAPPPGTPTPRVTATPPATPPAIVTDPARVRVILADPRYAVPDPGRGAPPGTLHWLRQNVARFSSGDDHARRRDLAEQLLRGLDPRLLRALAYHEASAVIDRAHGRPFDAVALVAKRVSGLVLAAALGAADPEQVTRELPGVAAAYLPGAADPQRADGSVARLTELLPAGPAELVAARIGLLIQAYAATAGLIGTSVAAGLRADGGAPAADLVRETLLRHPPVLVTGRVGPDGETITLHLAAAGRDPRNDPAGSLAFGHGMHACPGAAQARALAEGAAEPLLARCRLADERIAYPAPPAPQVPERLELTET